MIPLVLASEVPEPERWRSSSEQRKGPLFQLGQVMVGQARCERIGGPSPRHQSKVAQFDGGVRQADPQRSQRKGQRGLGVLWCLAVAPASTVALRKVATAISIFNARNCSGSAVVAAIAGGAAGK